MKRSRARRTALLTLAAIFLVVASVWDAFAAIGRTLAGFVPWERFKQAFAVLIDRLPAPLVLLIFLVPFLIVEPLLVVATVAIAMGYVVSGVIAWIVLKLLAVALLPAIFDLTQHKLMTMPGSCAPTTRWWRFITTPIRSSRLIRKPPRLCCANGGCGRPRRRGGFPD